MSIFVNLHSNERHFHLFITKQNVSVCCQCLTSCKETISILLLVFDHSLIRSSSWLPIYIQRSIGQIFIYSPEIGKIFPIAGLIASGYASLINNGVVLPSFNMGYVIQPVECSFWNSLELSVL